MWRSVGVSSSGFLAFFALLAGSGPMSAIAAGYPEKPISIVVPFSAGSATDKLARLIGEGLSRRLGQAVVVENKAGASGFLGTPRSRALLPTDTRFW